MNKSEFVKNLGELLAEAKPNLVKCEFKRGIEIKEELNGTACARIIPGDEYVVVTCENGYHYFINVTADSLASIAMEVFGQMQHK